MRRISGGSFVFILFIALMAYNLIVTGQFSNPAQWFYAMALRLPGIVIGLTFHEFAHAFSAWKLGDMTPKAQGRVTLNPLAHIDPFGILALVLVGFGWGRPVQVNPFAFKKNRRRANIIVDVAGVTTNFVIAFIFTAIYILSVLQWHQDQYGAVCTILVNIIYINLVLMLFNLLPVPPLDGFGIITEIFDLRRYNWYHTLYNSGMFILMVIVFFGISGKLLTPALQGLLVFVQNVWLSIL